MFEIHSNGKVARKSWTVLAMVLCVLLSAIPSQAQKKSNKKGLASPNTEPQRLAFDITKIVWPSPPEIPRVAFQNFLTGQTIDWAGLQTNQKPKQSWMDRLAGEQPDRSVKDVQQKVGYQMLRV